MPNSVLTLRAGRGALARIREAGLQAADVEIVPGAAGGPKGLGIAGLDRAVFVDSRGALPFIDADRRFDAFRNHVVPLDRANIGEALLASASIPLVLEGVADIPSAPAGTYWDGGIIDYHLHLPYHRAQGLVVYPHFVDRIVPGWLDKGMPWRHASGEWRSSPPRATTSRAFRTASFRIAATSTASRATTRDAWRIGAARSRRANGSPRPSTNSCAGPTRPR